MNLCHQNNSSKPDYDCGKHSANTESAESLKKCKHKGECTTVCTICRKSFKNSSYLKLHMLLHSQKHWEYLCEFCGKSFVTLTLFKAHEKSHRTERTFVCEVEGCHASFKNRSALNFHMKRKHGPKTYSCTEDGCDKSYATQNQLRHHLTEHKLLLKKNPFKCDKCVRSFTNEVSLFNHAYSVHGVKGQFKCQYCAYTGNISYNLKSHLQKYCRSIPKEETPADLS